MDITKFARVSETLAVRLVRNGAYRSFHISLRSLRDDYSSHQAQYDSGNQGRQYERRDNFDRNDGYQRGGYGHNRRSGRNFDRSGGSHRGYGNRDRFEGGRGGSRFGRSREDEQDLDRNRVKRHGEEGDGLRGLDDYAVDIEQLKDLKWTDLVRVDESEEPHSEVGFSEVQTLTLADHKVISRALVNSLHYNRAYVKLTPVQAQTILPIMMNQSVVVRAKTGTGKTGAFAIPTIQKVLEAKRQGVQGVKAVVISPTRELAQQISDEITAITAYGELRNIKTMCFVGGLSKSNQIRNGLTGRNVVDIVVATPGRLLDLISEQQVIDNFASVTIKVLDEADRLLDIGFKDALTDIDNIMKSVHNATFQTLLFSATTDSSMMDFAEGELGGNAAIIDTVPANEPQAQELVHQESMVCTNWRDIYYAGAQAMEHETHTSDQMKQHFKAIVFMPTVLLVQHYGAVLKEYFAKTRGRGFVQSIHGRLTQAKRQRISDEFRKSREGILVTTDVVARGMDFPNVSHVFQLGCPPEIASYIHRIGRTARIGHEGKSLLIHTPQESRFLEELQKKKITMQRYLTFEPKVRLVKRIEEICPTKLEDDGDADSVYTSLFAAYEPVKKNFKMDGPGFLRDQDHFAALLGIENPRLPIRLRDSWQRDISTPPRSRSYGGRGGGRPQGQNNRGRRMRW